MDLPLLKWGGGGGGTGGWLAPERFGGGGFSIIDHPIVREWEEQQQWSRGLRQRTGSGRIAAPTNFTAAGTFQSHPSSKIIVRTARMNDFPSQHSVLFCWCRSGDFSPLGSIHTHCSSVELGPLFIYFKLWGFLLLPTLNKYTVNASSKSLIWWLELE